MAGSTLRGRRLLVLALLFGLGLTGAVGFQVWKRRQPIRPFATFPVPNRCALAFPDESTLVALSERSSPDVVPERIYSIGGETAALVTECAFEKPGEYFPLVSIGPHAVTLTLGANVLQARSLPSLRELASIKINPALPSTRAFPLSDRLVALVYTDVEEDHGPNPVPILLDIYDAQDGSLVGRVERKEIAARIAPSNVYFAPAQGVFLDHDRSTLHLLLEGGIWIEWSLAEKRTTKVRRLPWSGVALGLSSEGELLLAQSRGGLSAHDFEIVACPPDEGKKPRRIAPDLTISGIYTARGHALMSPSGDRIVIETIEPGGSAYVVEVATSRRWRLVPSARSVFVAGAFSPSGERVAFISESHVRDDVFFSIELFELPP
jgi:hypothetical protein